MTSFNDVKGQLVFTGIIFMANIVAFFSYLSSALGCHSQESGREEIRVLLILSELSFNEIAYESLLGSVSYLNWKGPLRTSREDNI